ncbi:hypothetical protein [Variovorax sp.]|uniref:hypothetical protein n=1 Tax=Variovorax sp. TaxID=1871043 RepID=UPI002D5BEA54|nr:hypothetical protein [Variovorax sp.]HYP82789.1 hypothetical protein [Variovorax sp.]
MTSAHWNVFSRCLAAVLGGYALASTLPVAIVAACWGGAARSDAVLIAMQMSFAVYAGAIMWAFSAGSARSAWAGLGVLVLLSSLVAWALL